MGRFNQKRIIRKIELEKLLTQISPPLSPKVNLEQYTTPEKIVANILYLIAYSNLDIPGKTVLDLGCGTGRISLGSSFLGAREVVGIDIDKTAIKMANENANRLNLEKKINWITGDISVIRGHFDTVIQNPPFGIQKRHADRKFLRKALEVGKTVYSIHSHPLFDRNLIKQFRKNSDALIRVNPSQFLQKFIEKHNGSIRAVYSMIMTIPRMFNFHRKMQYSFVIDLYWIEHCD
jgi:putative methylase